MTGSVPPHRPPGIRDLVGDDVTDEELARLRQADALLRSVGPPPAVVPPSLDAAVLSLVRPRRRLRTAPWRIAIAAAVTAAVAVLFFVLGAWTGGDGFVERAAVHMSPTGEAAGASAVLRLGEPDASGNWRVRVEVSGLPELPPGAYYVLWLARDGQYAATCGTFRVRDDGSAEVEMNASYRLRDFDAWVVTARHPDDLPEAQPPWLLQADVRA